MTITLLTADTQLRAVCGWRSLGLTLGLAGLVIWLITRAFSISASLMILLLLG